MKKKIKTGERAFIVVANVRRGAIDRPGQCFRCCLLLLRCLSPKQFLPSFSLQSLSTPYLVGELVRVALVDRLGGEEEGVFVSHLKCFRFFGRGKGRRESKISNRSASASEPTPDDDEFLKNATVLKSAEKSAIHELLVLLLRADDQGTDHSRHCEAGRRRSGGERARGRRRSCVVSDRLLRRQKENERAQWRLPTSSLLRPPQPRRPSLRLPPCKRVERKRHALRMTSARAERTQAQERSGESGRRRRKMARLDDFSSLPPP